MQKKHTHKKTKRPYKGVSKPGIKSMTMTPASLYTHFKDMRVGSPTFGKRVPLV